MKQLHAYPTRQVASEAAAIALANAVDAQLKAQRNASLVVSGGSTPLECFRLLSEYPLDWTNVIVTLSDERSVAEDHPASNQLMVRENLLVNSAASASYRPPEEAMHEPFAAVLIGMGDDGHFASLFPDAENLQTGLDLNQQSLAISVTTASSPYPRISMPMARILRTDCLILLAFGEEKRRLIETPGDTPVAALFKQTITPVQVYWAP